MWTSVKEELPKKSGDYKVEYDGRYSADVGRFNRGLFGLGYLTYWSDERFTDRIVTHWWKD